MSVILGDGDCPSLQFFARRCVFRNMQEILPRWEAALISDNTILQSRNERLKRDIEKMSMRLRRRCSRIKEALHEIQYSRCKMIEVAEAIRAGHLHYAESELRTLSGLNGCEDTLRTCLHLIEVNIRKMRSDRPRRKKEYFLMIYPFKQYF